MPPTRRRRSQIADDDDDGEVDSVEQPTPRQIRTQRLSANTSAAAAAAAAAATDHDDDPDDDTQAQSTSRGLAAFKSQPLDKSATALLKQSMSAYGPREDFIRQALTQFRETAEQVAESDGSIKTEAFDLIEQDFRKLLDAQAECDFRRQALATIKRKLDAEEEIHDAAAMYEKLLKEQLGAYRKKTARQKYAQSEEYRTFREVTWGAAEDGPMPPIHDFLPAEEGDEENSDDEIVTGGETQTYKCPLTAQILVDPLSSTECRHSYSKEAILEYVSASRDVVCPATGCNAMLSRRKLKPNPQLAKRVAAFQRREEERNMSSRVRTEIVE